MKGLVDGCGCFPVGRHYAGIAHLLRVQATGIIDGFDADAGWIDLPVALVDVETTGREPAMDWVVEVGIVVGRAGEVVERRSWLINPQRPIPEEARNVHGITDEMVADCPPFAAVAHEVVAMLKGVIPAAYNASFDRAFLVAELERAGVDADARPAFMATGAEWIDPLVWARELHQLEKGKSLGDVTRRLGISLETAHRATDDAEAALRVMYAFAKDVRVPKSYGGLTQEQRRLSRLQEEERSRWRNRPT